MLQNELYSLKRVLVRLTPEEFKTLQSHLSGFHTKFGDYDPKTLQLANLLLSNTHLNESEIKERINPQASFNTFGKLVKRLKDKAYESLVLDVNIYRKDAYSKYYVAKFELRKKLSQAEILLGKGLSEEAEALYKYIIIKAKEFELYDVLIETLYLYQKFTGLRQGFKEHDNFKKEIIFYENCRRILNHAQYLYQRFVAQEELKGDKESHEIIAGQVMAELEEDYKITQSDNVLYYNYLIKIYYLQQLEKYKSVEKVCLELLQMISKNKAKFMNKLSGSVYLNLSENSFYLNDFHAALNYTLQARKYFKSNTFNYFQTFEYEFLVNFYTNNGSAAEKIVLNLLKTTDKDEAPIRYNKRLYFYACVLLLQKKYENISSILQQTAVITKDKEGWNIGMRILLIMSQLERGLLDRADIQIDNMKQYVSEIIKMRPVRKRVITILRILLALEKQAFDFKKVIKLHPNYFDLLASNDKEYKWQILSPELIRFDKWFMAMASKKEYVHELINP